MTEIKDRILRTTREKQLVTYKGSPMILLDDFSAENLSAIKTNKQTNKLSFPGLWAVGQAHIGHGRIGI